MDNGDLTFQEFYDTMYTPNPNAGPAKIWRSSKLPGYYVTQASDPLRWLLVNTDTAKLEYFDTANEVVARMHREYLALPKVLPPDGYGDY